MQQKILLLITALEHIRKSDGFYSHSPFVKEINYIGSSYDEIVIFAPLSKNKILEKDSYLHLNEIKKIISVPQMGGLKIINKIRVLIRMPYIVFKLARAINLLRKNNDLTIHIRVPGNIGLISLFVMGFYPSIKKFAKYTGEWDDINNLPLSYKIHKFFLSKLIFFNGIVLVYTDKKNKKNIVNSYASSLTNDEIRRAKHLAENKFLNKNLLIIFVGRLSKNKGVDLLLKAMKHFSNNNKIKWKVTICGSGDYENNLKNIARDLNISENISWKGWINDSQLKKIYSTAHIICQPSINQESWGKALQEGMIYGCIPLASNLGGPKKILKLAPYLLFEPGNYKMISRKISRIVNDKKIYIKYKNWSVRNAKIKSLENFNSHVKEELKKFYD